MAAADGHGWVPVDACTLPTAEQPIRLAEFAALFTSLRTLERREPGWLRLSLAETGGLQRRVRELVARESQCCSFFDFGIEVGPDGEVNLDVRVPPDRAVVLDGLTAADWLRSIRAPNAISSPHATQIARRPDLD